MDNNLIFKALSSKSRIKIIKKCANEEIHLSALARDIGLSKPVISKHVKLLEKAGILNKRVVGNVHLFSANFDVLDKAFKPFIKDSKINLPKNKTILDALKQIPGIEIKKSGKKQLITSIDGEKGFFIYEVNGKIPEKSIDEYKTNKNITIKLKKLVPIEKRKIKIEIKEK